MDTEVLEVAPHNGPKLLNGDSPGPGAGPQAVLPDGQSPSPSALGPAPVPSGWQPDQAEAFLTTIWNLGCLFYGPQWRASHDDFASWSTAAAVLLGEVLPAPTDGGVGGLTVAVIQCAGGVTTMVVKRRDLIAAGPVFGRKKPKAAPAAPNGEPAPAIRQEGGSGGRVSAQDSNIIELSDRARASSDAAPSLAGLGYSG